MFFMLARVELAPLAQHGWSTESQVKPAADALHGWSKEIAPGVFMPYVNLGHPDDNSSTATDVEMWLRLGGVGLDTAWNYHNQPFIAEGIERSGRRRDSIFVTTKIPCFSSGDLTLAFVLDDLRQLRTE